MGELKGRKTAGNGQILTQRSPLHPRSCAGTVAHWCWSHDLRRCEADTLAACKQTDNPILGLAHCMKDIKVTYLASPSISSSEPSDESTQSSESASLMMAYFAERVVERRTMRAQLRVSHVGWCGSRLPADMPHGCCCFGVVPAWVLVYEKVQYS